MRRLPVANLMAALMTVLMTVLAAVSARPSILKTHRRRMTRRKQPKQPTFRTSRPTSTPGQAVRSTPMVRPPQPIQSIQPISHCQASRRHQPAGMRCPTLISATSASLCGRPGRMNPRLAPVKTLTKALSKSTLPPNQRRLKRPKARVMMRLTPVILVPVRLIPLRLIPLRLDPITIRTSKPRWTRLPPPLCSPVIRSPVIRSLVIRSPAMHRPEM